MKPNRGRELETVRRVAVQNTGRLDKDHHFGPDGPPRHRYVGKLTSAKPGADRDARPRGRNKRKGGAGRAGPSEWCELPQHSLTAKSEAGRRPCWAKAQTSSTLLHVEAMRTFTVRVSCHASRRLSRTGALYCYGAVFSFSPPPSSRLTEVGRCKRSIPRHAEPGQGRERNLGYVAVVEIRGSGGSQLVRRCCRFKAKAVEPSDAGAVRGRVARRGVRTLDRRSPDRAPLPLASRAGPQGV